MKFSEVHVHSEEHNFASCSKHMIWKSIIFKEYTYEMVMIIESHSYIKLWGSVDKSSSLSQKYNWALLASLRPLSHCPHHNRELTRSTGSTYAPASFQCGSYVWTESKGFQLLFASPRHVCRETQPLQSVGPRTLAVIFTSCKRGFKTARTCSSLTTKCEGVGKRMALEPISSQ